MYNKYRKEVRMIEKQDWQWLIAIVISVIVQIWAVKATKAAIMGLYFIDLDKHGIECLISGFVIGGYVGWRMSK